MADLPLFINVRTNQAIPIVGFPATGTTTYTGNHSITASDLGQIIKVSNGNVNGAFVTTLPSGITQAGPITLVNADSTSVLTVQAGGGATLDSGTFALGPTQRTTIFCNGDSVNWTTINKPDRIQTSGAVTLYVDASTGSDGNNSIAFNSSTPMQTPTHAYNWLTQNIDLAPGNSTVTIRCNGALAALTAQPAPLSDSFFPVTFSFTSGSSISATGGDAAIFVKGQVGVVVEADGPSGCTLSSANFNGIRTAYQAYVSFGPNIHFGACGQSHLFIGLLSTINSTTTTSNITGNSPIMIWANGGIYDGGNTWNFPGNITFSNTVILADVGGQFYSAETFTGAGSITGQRFQVTDHGRITNTSGNAHYFPGTIEGQMLNGGVYGGQ